MRNNKFEVIDKRVDTFKGQKVYLVGTGEGGIKYWLVEPSWDCGWYWGFGYLQAYTNNNNPHLSRDIFCHTHVSSLGKDTNLHDAFAEFKELTMTDDELWEFCDLMKSFYTLSAAAELFKHGCSNYSSKGKMDEMLLPDYVKNINQVILPKLFERVLNLLKGDN